MKALWAAAFVVCVVLKSFAQGTVNLANNSASGVTNILTAARVPQGTSFNVALFHLPDSVYPPSNADFDNQGTPLSPWTGFYADGLFDGGTRTTPLTTPPDGYAWFQVKAWETAYGASYSEALAAPSSSGRRALIGTSGIIRVRTGLGGTNPPGSLISAGLAGFTLVPVPDQVAISDFNIDAVVTFNTTTGHIYSVQRTPALNSGNWQPVPGATNILGTGGPVSIIDRNAHCSDAQYYRVWQVQ